LKLTYLVDMDITVLWSAAPCGLVYIYCILEESVTFIF
jgi:hypothetical protein